MSLLFCMMAWSWLRKLVRGYCSAGSFIAPPNRNRFLMLAGLLMSIWCIWYGRWWLWWYFLVSYWCLLYMVWAIDVCCILKLLLEWTRPWLLTLKLLDTQLRCCSLYLMGMHHGFNKKTKLVFWFPMSDINC